MERRATLPFDENVDGVCRLVCLLSQAERRSGNTATAAAAVMAAAVQLHILGIFQCNRVQAKHELS